MEVLIAGDFKRKIGKKLITNLWFDLEKK